MRLTVLVYGCLVMLCSAVSGWASIAMVAEVKALDGVAEVREAGKVEWKRAVPLLSLGQGDLVRVSRSGSVMVMYANGKDVVRVTAANSPFTVKALKKGDSRNAKTQALFDDLTGFLGNKKRDVLSAPLAVRGERMDLPSSLVPARPTYVLAPAQTVVMNPRPGIEWVGPPRRSYSVRILQGDRVVWERTNLVGTRLAYPAEEAALTEGERYTLSVQANGSSPATSWLQVATKTEREAIEAKCARVGREAAESLPAAVKTSLVYAALASEGYWFDARARLISALNADNDNPLLHLLMGDYYSHIGMQDMASEEYDEAAFLLRVKR